MQRESKLRLRIEDMATVNPRYATVFEGLKLNQPRNSAVVYPFAFLMRRLLFAIAIVFMSQQAILATVTTLVLSVAMLGFLVIEQPWKNPEHQKLDIANEALLTLALLLVLCGQCTTMDNSQSEIFGWILIGVLTLVIHLNVIVIGAQGYYHCKLLYTAFMTRKQAKVTQQPTEQTSIKAADMGMHDPSRLDSQPDQDINVNKAAKMHQEPMVIEEEESEEGSESEVEVQRDLMNIDIRLSQGKLIGESKREENGPQLHEDIVESGSLSDCVSEARNDLSEQIEAGISHIVEEVPNGRNETSVHVIENPAAHIGDGMSTVQKRSTLENPETFESEMSRKDVTISMEMESNGDVGLRLESIPDNFAEMVKNNPGSKTTYGKFLGDDQVFDMLQHAEKEDMLSEEAVPTQQNQRRQVTKPAS